MDYEDRLEAKYPEFRANEKNTMTESSCELTDEMVWSKAVKDTVGLQNYYEANKQYLGINA